jgi:hypothetical protein
MCLRVWEEAGCRRFCSSAIKGEPSDEMDGCERSGRIWPRRAHRIPAQAQVVAWDAGALRESVGRGSFLQTGPCASVGACECSSRPQAECSRECESWAASGPRKLLMLLGKHGSMRDWAMGRKEHSAATSKLSG